MQNEIAALEESVRRHRQLYYAGMADISDVEYDALEERLRGLDPKNALFAQVGVSSGKVPHPTPMLSLMNCFTEEEFQSWTKTIPWGPKASTVTMMPKIDGVSLELHYDHTPVAPDNVYVLKQALTRGDGHVGEDVTEHAKHIVDIPQTLEIKDFVPFVVRGETVILKKDFAAMQEREGLQSARNAVAGTFSGDDPEVAARRKLHFIAYNILGVDFRRFNQRLDALAALGFNVVQHKSIGVVEAPDAWRSLMAKRDQLPYEADGLVLAVDSIRVQNELGSTSHHPRAFVAWKFEAIFADTLLEGVEWQVSRTGRINPVASFEPVFIEGATLSRATLCNVSEIERLGLRLNGIVRVSRQGGVIPKILSYSEPEDVPLHTFEVVQIPQTCPVCGSPTEIRGEIKVLFCTNEECPAVLASKIEHYVKCMEIDGVGPSLIDKLISMHLVKWIPDLYSVQVHDLMRVPGVQDKAARNIWGAIHRDDLKAPYAKFIWALGIPGVGKVLAQDLAKFGTITKLRKAMPPDLTTIPGIGDKANIIVEYFGHPEVVELIDALTGYREDEGGRHRIPLLTFEESPIPKDAQQSGGAQSAVLAGKSILFTGSLSVGRKEFAGVVENAGGKVLNSISKKVDYLIVGENPGGSFGRAKELGVKCITEQEARDMIAAPFNEATEVLDKAKEDVVDLKGVLATVEKLVEYVLEKHPETRSNDSHIDADGLVRVCSDYIKQYGLGIKPNLASIVRCRRKIQFPPVKDGVRQQSRFLPTPAVLARRLVSQSVYKEYLGYAPAYIGYTDEKMAVLKGEVHRLLKEKEVSKEPKKRKDSKETNSSEDLTALMGGL